MKNNKSIIKLFGLLLLATSSNYAFGYNNKYCQFAYVNHNLTNDIYVFGINKSTGVLEPLHLPPVYTGNNPGSFLLHPNGKFLYVLGGNSNDVTAYKINQDTGQLSAIQTISTSGVGPWGGTVTPKTGAYLYVNNNVSNNITMFKVDSNTGLLSLSKTAIHPNGLVENALNANGPDSIKITSGKKYAYVTNANSNNMTIYNYNENTGDLILKNSYAMNIPGGVKPRQVSLYPYSVPSDPTSVPHNTNLYLMNQDTNNIIEYKLDDNELIIPNDHPPVIETGLSPMTLNTEGTYNYTYVTNFIENNISQFKVDKVTGHYSKLNPSKAAVINGQQAKGIYSNLGYVYTTNFASNDVSTFKISSDGSLHQILPNLKTGGVNPGNITFTPFPKDCK